MRERVYRAVAKRLTSPLTLCVLILQSTVVVLSFAIVRSQPAPASSNTLAKNANGSVHSFAAWEAHTHEQDKAGPASPNGHATTHGPADSASCGTPYDTIPNFALNPTILSSQDGPWSSSSTWSLGRLPTAQDVVVVRHQVTYDSQNGIADVIGIDGGASLQFRTDVSTKLQVGILKVFDGGTLTIGTAVTPVAANVTAELVIRNRPLNLTTDPDQFGTGLLSVNGTVTMHGAVKSPTFVRTAAEPRVGHTTLSLEQPATGWRVGDRIFLPDTRQVHPDNWFNPNWPLQMEERNIQGISADGRTVTLSSALSFDHRGARDANGTPTVLANGIKLLPHVGNLTRNVIIRSENPSGTRGHALFTLRSAINIRYVQFQDLGRTKAEPLNPTSNHIGRYPLHIHQLWGPVNPSNTGYQFQLVGNAINDSLKWPLAVHGSHFGLVRQNVIYGGNQLTGAGIAVEDGSETENLFEENFVAYIRGNINPRESGPSTAPGSTPGSAAECFWAAGFNNRFVNNVASACRNPTQQVVSGPGWKFIVPAAPFTARNPLFRGADMTVASQTRVVTPQFQPILEFRGNEVYGLAADGLTTWQLGLDGDPGVMPETVIQDFRVWHTYEGAIWNYPTNRMTINGLVYRIDPAVSVFWPAAFQCGDYRNIDITIRGGSIHAGSVFGGCTDPLGTYRLENVDAVTRNHAFAFETPATPGTQQDRPPSGVTMILRNNTIRAWPGQPLRTVEMDHTLARGNAQPGDNYDVLVYDYQGQTGNNFQVYFGVQATQNLYGGPAPCNDTTTRPEVSGITCNISAPIPDNTPPSNPSGLATNAVSSSQVNLTWIASSDPESGIAMYELERCQGGGCTNFVQLATPPGASFADNGVTANTTYRYQVRAKNGATPSLASAYSNIASATTPSAPAPTPTPTPTPAPVLFAADGTNRAIVLDSVTMMRDPLSVVTTHNFSSDQRRRVTLFALNVDIQPGQDFSDMTAQGQDVQNGTYPLVVESARKVPGFSELTQITIKLPDQMMNAATVSITITYHGLSSNTVTLMIVPEGPLSLLLWPALPLKVQKGMLISVQFHSHRGFSPVLWQ